MMFIISIRHRHIYFYSTTKRTTLKPTPPDLSKFNFRHNLRSVITKSLKFFEAQRSGPLPADNSVNWRSHSDMRDGYDHNVDLKGGYYTG